MQTKLAAQRALHASMFDLETIRQKWLAEGMDNAEADRDIAGVELAQVLVFCADCGIQAQSLHSLLRDLAALSAGAAPSRMLLPTKPNHRRPDSPIIESTKGRLAAIMEHRQGTGLTRNDASLWVIRNVASSIGKILGAKLPMFQAIMRGHLALAAKGNVAAQRSVIETVQAIEREAGIVATEEEAKAGPEMSQTELARRVAFAMQLAQRADQRQKRQTEVPSKDAKGKKK